MAASGKDGRDSGSLFHDLRRPPSLWFSFRMPVRRFDYIASGLVLVPVKFGLDSLVYRHGTGEIWSWTSYVHPSFELRFGEVWSAAASTRVRRPPWRCSSSFP